MSSETDPIVAHSAPKSKQLIESFDTYCAAQPECEPLTRHEDLYSIDAPPFNSDEVAG